MRKLLDNKIFLLPCAVFLAVTCFSPSLPAAKTFRVNVGSDIKDINPGDGNCVAAILVSPPFVFIFCSLRAAIQEANAYPGSDVVELPFGYMSLSEPGRNEDGAFSGDLDITESVVITGQGGDKTIIDARGIDRIFDIVGEDAVVAVNDITLLNGSVSTGGGAVRNAGELTLSNVVLLFNQAIGHGSAGLGGQLYNSGQCIIKESTLQGGEADEGGGVFNRREGNVEVISSTISSNRAAIGGGASNYGTLRLTNSTVSHNGSTAAGSGGGIENRRTLLLQHATIAYNQAVSGGGIGNKSLTYLQNSIIAENVGGDCSGTKYLFSQGYNIDGDYSCALGHEADKSGVEARLRELQNYGGSTKTHELYPDSPARDTGLSLSFVTHDQRGLKRPEGSGADRGAVEYAGFPLAPTLVPLIIK